MPLSLNAHALGASVEREVDGYLVDIGYDSDPIVAHSPVRFDFALYEATNKTIVPFDRLWLRLEKERKIIFAGGIARPQFGATGATVLMPEAGNYQLFVRFEDDDGALVELETELAVQPKESPIHWVWWVGPLAILAAFGLGFFTGMRRRS